MMKKNVLFIGIIIVLLFVIFRQYNSYIQQRQSQESATEFLNDTIAYYQNAIGQQVAQKQAIQGDKDALQILLSKQIDSTGQLKALVKKFRTVQAAGNITQETRIDTVFIPFADPIHYEFNRNFNKETEFYSITGRVYNTGLDIASLYIPNTISFALGDTNTGWFKNEYRFEAINSNPYIKTTGLDGYTLELPTKRLGLSLYAGYGFSSGFKFQPSAGVALTYTILRF